MKGGKENLRKPYQKLSDEEIERIARYEAQDLTPEAADILKEEIRRRRLSEGSGSSKSGYSSIDSEK